ncbi:MAG: putative Ig domain-containing protein [Thermoguttaceae bacterium]
MGLITVFRRFWQTNGKSPRSPALRRRLAVESLEQRALLSVAPSPFVGTIAPTGPSVPAASATQHMTVADLPLAAQHAIAAAIGQEAKLTASDAVADDNFGGSIAISGSTVVVQGDGAICVFTPFGSGGANMTQVAKLTPSDGAAGDFFGASVSISGNTVVVGAPDATVGGNTTEGAAYVFTEPASGWANMTQTAKLTDSNGTASECFGTEVSISGNTVVVGTLNSDSADVFTEPGAGWMNMTQTARLTSSDNGWGFGQSVAISGNTVAVGAPDVAMGTSIFVGAAYVFTEPASGWANMTQTAELTASDGRDSECFGQSVAISGNTMVVGTFAGGGVYVFTEPGTGWANMTQTAKLTGADGPVAISGNTLVVGADFATVGGNAQQGAADVYTEPASGWANASQTAELTASDGTAQAAFGCTVAISGNTVLVASSNLECASYVFTQPGSGWTNMTQTAKLTASDGAYPDDLGDSVAISGNTLVVGAPEATVGSNVEQGAAYVFSESGTGWANMTQVAKLTASDGTADDGFGISVSISGNTIVVGQYAGNTTRHGAGYVFTEPASGWANMTQTAKLTASDSTVSYEFGCSVAISGNTVVIGAYFLAPICSPGVPLAVLTLPGTASLDPLASLGSLGHGVAYVFTEPNTGWANMTQTAKLTPSDGSYLFGASVAISGNTVVVGAPTYIPDCCLFTTNWADGAAYVFTEPSTGWTNMTQTAKLTASDGATYYNFGDSVAISGNTVVVGTPYSLVVGSPNFSPNPTQGPGAAYVFTAPGSGWANMTQTAKLTASDGTASDYFGNSVAIDGDTVVVGAPYSADGGNYDSGAAYVFQSPSSGWVNMTQTAKLTASDGAGSNGDLGSSVSISGNTVVVGAPGATVGDNVDQGAAYVFGTTTEPTPTPTITSPAIKSAIVGKKCTYQVKTNASAGQEITYSLGAAPAGMGINASTGLVTWVPNVFQTGSSAVTVLARDQYGDTAQQTFSISVSSFFTSDDPFAPMKKGLVIIGPAYHGLM